ncbi:MAG: hypothetical protein DMD28_07580 [Gemmatimonadetes bacterium]|nr:MAG: hypothetical protein DMD28_07580 [Gemmatimonadota bacterium]
MRRTTICRFNRAALLALVVVPLACWSLRAQDTTRAAPETTQAAPLGGGPLPATHTVARGETLWSIAQLYFSDPLLWPEIYRLNTSLIEDPHWIYPGEVLNVSGPVGVAQAPETTAVQVTPGGDTVRAVPVDTLAVAPVDTALRDTTQALFMEPPPAAEESYRTIFDRPRSRTTEVQDILRAYANQPYHPVRRGEFYAAGFLTERENLPWGRVLGTIAKPAIPRLTERSTAYQFEQIVIDPPSRVSYHVNDSVLIARIDRDEGDWGDVVVPVGIARVTEVARKQLLAEVVLQFGRIHDGHLVLPLEPFKDPGEMRPTPIEQGLGAQVINQRDLHTITISQQVVFLNRGRADGVVPGDVFQVYTGQAGTPSQELRAVVEVVHTREHSCSGLVLTLGNPKIVPQLPARLIRKMPS